MKVHVFAPNIVIHITFYWFEAGQKLVLSRTNYFSSVAIELLLQDGQRKLCGFLLVRSRSNYFAYDGQHALGQLGEV